MTGRQMYHEHMPALPCGCTQRQRLRREHGQHDSPSVRIDRKQLEYVFAFEVFGHRGVDPRPAFPKLRDDAHGTDRFGRVVAYPLGAYFLCRESIPKREVGWA